MRLAIPAAPAHGKLSPKLGLGWALGLGLGLGLGLAMAAAVFAANLTYDRLFHRGATPGPGSGAGPEPAAEKKPGHDLTTTVVLAEGKFRTAQIRVEPVREVELPREVGVTGRIEADPNRRIVVRPKAPGVVRTVPVLPGTRVRKGDALVVLDSPEVGSARLLIRERQRELATVRVEAGWKAEVAANTEAAIALLSRRGTAPDFFKQFATKSLGTFRGTLISAYAEHELAEHEQQKMTDLNTRKIVGEHPLFAAIHNHEGAQAKYEGTLDQVRHDVAQQDLVARQMVRNAEEMVVDAAQRLRILGVAEDINDLLAHPERASALPPGSEDLTAYPIVAPIDGTIVSTSTVASQRVEPVDTLFVLADLSEVYVAANVPESDFAALPGLKGGTVRLTATAYPGREFDARMIYTGAEVDPATRSVRLVAATANPDGLLKLGMFARIALDTAATEKAPTVPLGSVVEVDGKSAVFVPGKGDRTFVIRPVKLGREALGRQVVAEGLKAGDRVVAAGAFLLKSELILQNEAEE